MSVTLPKGELLDNAHIGTVCTRVKFAAKLCPGGSFIGHAVARLALARRAVERPASTSAPPPHQLPDMALDLRGQIDFELSAKVDSVRGGLRTTFESVPDVPVTYFKLDLLGGKRGLLQNSESLCGRAKRATAKLRGQNGATSKTRVKLRVACGKTGKRSRNHRRKAAR